MRITFYSLLTAGALFFLAPGAAQSTTAPTPDNPTEAQRKTDAREKVATAKKASFLKRSTRHKKSVVEVVSRGMRVALGLEESKAVTSPRQLTRQLHRHQRQLQVRARMSSRAHHRRAHS